MADETKEIIHQHYANATAAIAAMNDQNWAYEEAANRIIVMDGATPVYFETASRLIIGGSFINNQTAAPQSGGFNISGNGIIGGTLTLTGVQTNSAEIAVGASLGMRRTINTGYITVSGGNAINSGANLVMNGGAHATGANDWSFRSGATDIVVWDDSAALLTITGGVTLSGNATIGGTLGVTGVATFMAAPVFSAFSNRIPYMNVSGVLSSHSDMAYDGTTITWGSGNTITRATGATALGSTLSVAGNLTLSTLSSGRIPVVSTSGLITQDNLYWDATNDSLGIGSGASSPAGSLDIRKSQTSTLQGIVFNSDNTNTASHARWQATAGGASGGDAYFQPSISGVIDWSCGIDNSDGDAFVITPSSTPGGTTNGLRISTAGAVTIPGTLGVTGAISSPTFSGTITTPLTASLPVFTNGSSQLTTNAMTGTGSVMMSASPTTTGTLTGAAANFSGAVSTGALTATTGAFSEVITFSPTGAPIEGSVQRLAAGGPCLVGHSYGAYQFCLLDKTGSYVVRYGQSDELFEILADLSTNADLSVDGNSTLKSAAILTGGTTAGAGGTDWTNETSVNMSGKIRAVITPTANGQTYRLTNLVTGQIIIIKNGSGSYDLIFDADGTGTNDVYVPFGSSGLFYYNGTDFDIL